MPKVVLKQSATFTITFAHSTYRRSHTLWEGFLNCGSRHSFRLDVRGSAHLSTIHEEKSNKMLQCNQNFIISHLYEAQHVSGDTPPITRSLKLQWQPLVFHTWKVVGRVVGGTLCLTTSTNYTSNNLPLTKNQRLPVQF